MSSTISTRHVPARLGAVRRPWRRRAARPAPIHADRRPASSTLPELHEARARIGG